MPDTEDRGKREAARRRRFTEEFKRQVVEETLAGDASVAAIALRHRLNANLVFTWRRKLLPSLASRAAKPVKLLPVTITDSNATVPAAASEPVSTSRSARRSRALGAIEIELNGVRIVLKGAVDAGALRVVLAAFASR